MQKIGLLQNRARYGEYYPVRRAAGEALVAGGIPFAATIAGSCTFAVSMVVFGCGVLAAVAVNVAEYYLRGLKYPPDIMDRPVEDAPAGVIYRQSSQKPQQINFLLSAVESLLRGDEESLKMTDQNRIRLAGRILKELHRIRIADEFGCDELVALTDRYEEISGQAPEAVLVVEELEDGRLSHEEHLELLKARISLGIYRELFNEVEEERDQLARRGRELEEAVDQLHEELAHALGKKLEDIE